MPEYASIPLERGIEAIKEVDRVLYLSICGIRNASHSVEVIQAVDQWNQVMGREVDPVESARRIASAREAAAFAQRELDRGFPILHSHATAALWSVLEATVEDVVLEVLEYDSSSLAHPSLASIKLPLAEFEQLSKPDRLRFLLSEYTRSSKADLKLGVGRFETMLEPVRLSGGVEDSLRRDLLEHQQVRNVIVHRAGRADRRLLEHCPWLKVTLGALIEMTDRQYSRYRDAVFAYFIELIFRLFAREGITREEAEVRIRKCAESETGIVRDSPNPPTLQ